MTNKTTYNRTDKSKGSNNSYTRVDLQLTRDKRLGVIEKGIMVELLSNADTFVINKTLVQKDSGLGRAAFDKAWKKLETYGYIEMRKYMNIGSKGSRYHYTINEVTPLSTADLPNVGIPTVEESTNKNNQDKNNQDKNKTNTSDSHESRSSDSNMDKIFNAIKEANVSRGIDTTRWTLSTEDKNILEDLSERGETVSTLLDRIDRLEGRESLKRVSVSILYKDVCGESWRVANDIQHYKDMIKEMESLGTDLTDAGKAELIWYKEKLL